MTTEKDNKAKLIKLFAAIGSMVTLALGLMALGFGIGFGGAIGWPLFILFCLVGCTSASLAFYAWYLNDWY